MNKFSVFSVAMLASSAAFAGSPVFVPVETPILEVVIPASDWSGLYVGLQAGTMSGEAVGVTGAPNEYDGTLYGAHLGYNFDLGSFVLGAEIDYNMGEVDAIIGADSDNLAHVKARVGYDLGSALIYGVAGAAFTTLDNGTESNETGYAAGLGAEYRITSDWSVGGEYMYHKFEDVFDGFGGGIDLEFSTIQARVSYHF